MSVPDLAIQYNRLALQLTASMASALREYKNKNYSTNRFAILSMTPEAGG
jgi:hypothetical protein